MRWWLCISSWRAGVRSIVVPCHIESRDVEVQLMLPVHGCEEGGVWGFCLLAVRRRASEQYLEHKMHASICYSCNLKNTNRFWSDCSQKFQEWVRARGKEHDDPDTLEEAAGYEAYLVFTVKQADDLLPNSQVHRSGKFHHLSFEPKHLTPIQLPPGTRILLLISSTSFQKYRTNQYSITTLRKQR